MTKVLVTGANGYIAQWIVRYLIEGGYDVLGTVRSNDKGDRLARFFGPKFQYAVVPNIVDPHAFDQVLKDHPEITVVLHTASPFSFEVEEPERDILKPAIEGTKLILDSIFNYAPQVTRVVITASTAGCRPEVELPDNVANEETWTFIDYDVAKDNLILAYLALKPLAEKAAWDFVKEKKPNFTLTTVLPGYTFGPQCDPDDAKKVKLNQLMQVIDDLLELEPETRGPVKHFGPYIDVRDVAKAHIAPITDPKLHGERLLLVDRRFTMQTLADIVNREWPELKIWKGHPGGDTYKLRKLGKYDASKTKGLLGWEFIDIGTSVKDSVSQLFRARGSKI